MQNFYIYSITINNFSPDNIEEVVYNESSEAFNYELSDDDFDSPSIESINRILQHSLIN